MANRLRFPDRVRGFTLVESLLAMIVISTMVVAVAHIMVIALDSYRLIVDRREALGEARLAVNMITSELLSIADPASDISAMSPTSIAFAPASGPAVTYSVVGGTLMRGADVLADNVTANTGFIYYAAGGAAITDFAQTNLVHRIQVTVEVDAGASGQGKATISGAAYLRNRYYNGFVQM